MIRKYAVLLLLVPAITCCTSSPKLTREFVISSYPDAADVYVNDAERHGQTECVLPVRFNDANDNIFVRVHKPGYHSAGAVLSPSSQNRVYFILENDHGAALSAIEDAVKALR